MGFHSIGIFNSRITFWVALFLSVLGKGVTADSPSYLSDQKIEEELNLLNRPWRIEKVRLYRWEMIPPQLLMGLPPYDQEVEEAQTFLGEEVLRDKVSPAVSDEAESSPSVEESDLVPESSSGGSSIEGSGASSDPGSGGCFNPNNIPGFCD
ncbi:MAG: hypothetical protein HYS08_10095 [Chlamydiae bacterium]|nr:hypothetical protein [Chlamydiota bacterium]MBI3266246.1 hypothetical protein [Chlamydiota bacterium]